MQFIFFHVPLGRQVLFYNLWLYTPRRYNKVRLSSLCKDTHPCFFLSWFFPRRLTACLSEFCELIKIPFFIWSCYIVNVFYFVAIVTRRGLGGSCFFRPLRYAFVGQHRIPTIAMQDVLCWCRFGCSVSSAHFETKTARLMMNLALEGFSRRCQYDCLQPHPWAASGYECIVGCFCGRASWQTCEQKVLQSIRLVWSCAMSFLKWVFTKGRWLILQMALRSFLNSWTQFVLTVKCVRLT